MNTITDTCLCDIDYRCEHHDVETEQRFWAELIGLKPLPIDVANAYDDEDYKGRTWEGWDV